MDALDRGPGGDRHVRGRVPGPDRGARGRGRHLHDDAGSGHGSRTL